MGWSVWPAVLPRRGVIGSGPFLLGFFRIGLALQALDRGMPLPALRSAGGDPPHNSPWPMFRADLAVTTLTMSVSVSVGLLVPSVARGWIRRERLIPYVMGANVSTFVDTPFASWMLGNPAAVGVVLTDILSVSLISTGILILGYPSDCRLLAAIFERGLGHPLLLGFFLAAFLSVPLFLLALGWISPVRAIMGRRRKCRLCGRRSAGCASPSRVMSRPRGNTGWP